MSSSHFITYFPLVIDSLTYGIYSVLFFQSVQVLCSFRRPNYKFHLGVMILLFLLSTIHISLAYTWAFITDRAQAGIYEVFSLKNPPPVLYGPDDPAIVRRLGILIKIRYSLSNWIADGIFVHRCYVIWGRKWRPVAIPAFSFCCTLIGGIVGLLPLSGTSERVATAVCMGTIFFTNVLSSSLAAGRIWYISRRLARLMGGRNPRKKYMDLTAILLESGLIYPITLVVIIALFVAPTTSTVSVLIGVAVCYHIVAIAPTLIIVRIGMGVSTGDVETSVTLSSGPAARREILTTMEFQVRGTREDFQESLTDPKVVDPKVV